MSGLEFVASLIDALAWPLLLLAVFIIFKRPLSDLLASLSRFRSPGGWEAEFSREVDQTEQLAEAVKQDHWVEAASEDLEKSKTIRPPGKKPPTWRPIPEDAADRLAWQFENLERLAAQAPHAAVLEAWAHAEQEAGEALQRAGMDLGARPPVPTVRIVGMLVSEGYMRRSSIILAERLQMLRNAVAGNPNFQIDADAAVGYVRQAGVLAAILATVTEEYPPPYAESGQDESH